MGDTSIEWCDKTWNITSGCTRVSEGCRNCWAIRDIHRMAGNPNPKMTCNYSGLTRQESRGLDWTGVVRCHPDRLEQPLHWRKPARIFVNSMSDLFHEAVPDQFIHRVFAAMLTADYYCHTFLILTKRPERMRMFMNSLYRIPVLVNVPNHIWLGVSCEDQKTADERISILVQTPAAVRLVSYEPALSGVDFSRWLGLVTNLHGTLAKYQPDIHWIICGGESGPRARPCDVAWIRSMVEQCKVAGTPVFVKQLGSDWAKRHSGPGSRWMPSDRKGGNPEAWPPDLQVREFPGVAP